MTSKPKVSVIPIEQLSPNLANHNKGTERGNAAIESSVRSFGLHRGIAIAADNQAFAGSHILQKAVEAGFTEAVVIETTGEQLIVTRRTDIASASDPMAIAAGIADNRTQELNFELNPLQFQEDIQLLNGSGFELAATLYTEAELQRVFSANYGDDDEDDDESERGSSSGARPLAIVLSFAEYKRWQAVKDSYGIQDDKQAFLRLLQG